MTRSIVCAAVLLVLAAPASAQNASTAGALELYPTFNAIGARLTFTGDVNQNATAHLEWRPQGGATWTEGVAMTPIPNGRWAGSVLWLETDRPYDVRAVIDDPDGGSSATGTMRTRALPPAVPTGRTLWVALGGSDTNPGTSVAPLATLQQASVLAQPGDEIRVRPGLYYQTLDAVRAGTPTAPIRLVADAPGVVLDGSDPAYLHRTDWVDEGGGVWSAPYTGATRIVCADSLQRLYKQASLADLRAGANGVSQGFAFDGARLFVRLEDGSPPASHVMHVARYNVGVYVDVSDWQVIGFEIRFYGLISGGSGVRLRTADRCVISGNYIHVIGNRCIFITVGSSQALVERNTIRDPRLSTWPWAACKAHDEEDSAISNRGGRGNVVRLNDIRGNFNGIDSGDGNPNDENIGADFDVHDNVIASIGDDALEMEGAADLNVRIWRNDVDGVFNALSMAPSWEGPEYVLYNTFSTFTRSAFKFSISSVGHAWICHNTVVSTIAGLTPDHPSGPYANIHFRNNVMVAAGAPVVGDDTGESGSGNDFNGDVMWAPGSLTLFRWKGVNYGTLAALQGGTGFELNGRSGDPLFVTAASRNYRLAPASPAVDAGVRLPGINDAYSGALPDAGAWEFGQTDVVRPAPIQDLR